MLVYQRVAVAFTVLNHTHHNAGCSAPHVQRFLLSPTHVLPMPLAQPCLRPLWPLLQAPRRPHALLVLLAPWGPSLSSMKNMKTRAWCQKSFEPPKCYFFPKGTGFGGWKDDFNWFPVHFLKICHNWLFTFCAKSVKPLWTCRDVKQRNWWLATWIWNWTRFYLSSLPNPGWLMFVGGFYYRNIYRYV